MSIASQVEYVGVGEITKIEEILKETGAYKVFLVTGKSSYESSGAKAYLDNALKNIELVIFSEFGSLPIYEDVLNGAKIYQSFKPDLVIAVGGGLVMDVAKAINNGIAPLVAIPTTAGSGSEATSFAVVYKDGVKHSLSGEGLLPTYAIVDPNLSFTAPKAVVLASALDVLAQSIESYWSNQATEESKSYSLEALKKVLDNIFQAVEQQDRKAMVEMSLAAHLAGKAINIAKTTACHALSYGLTYRFGVPHGIAVASTLPPIMKFNNFKLPYGLTCQIIESMLRRFGIMGLSTYGVKESDIASLTKEVNAERLSNNPRPVSEFDIKSFYKNVL